jgi:hypothetical protein
MRPPALAGMTVGGDLVKEHKVLLKFIKRLSVIVEKSLYISLVIPPGL